MQYPLVHFLDKARDNTAHRRSTSPFAVRRRNLWVHAL